MSLGTTYSDQYTSNKIFKLNPKNSKHNRGAKPWSMDMSSGGDPNQSP
jgi:hypothetical protein